MKRKSYALAMLSAIGFNTYSAEQPVLKEAFNKAFKIGVAVNQPIYSGEDMASQHIISKQFNTITIENAMKAEPINPTPGVYKFSAADDFVTYGKANNMFIVGHTLVWHNQTPAWFFTNKDKQPNTPEQQLARLTQHIKTVAGRYANKVHAWDVVNEVFADDGSYRPTTWVNAMGGGDKLVKASFALAEKYAPNTELYYNDFNAWRPAKRDGIIRMINMLKAEGIRIDGVGIQAHWGLNFPQNKYIEEAIDAYAAAGVKVLITELDVDVLPLTKEGQIIGTGMLHPQFQLEEFKTFLDPYQKGLPTHVENQLTKRYKELFEIFYRKRDKIDRVTLWGLHDGMSWKNDYPIANRTNYPLLWNRDKTMKPAVNGIVTVAK
jgi:endo-1,4-beta-xylanase